MGGHYSEAALIYDFREGSPKACNELYDRCYYRLFILCMDMIDDQMASEDIAVETISKVFARNKDFDSLGAIIKFAFTTARNACINYIHKRQREEVHYKAHLANIESEETWKAQLEENEKVQAVIATIQMLTPNQRKAIEMYYFQGMSYQEIASEMNLTSKAVERTLEKGRHAIRVILGASGQKASDAMVFCLLIYISQYCK